MLYCTMNAAEAQSIVVALRAMEFDVRWSQREGGRVEIDVLADDFASLADVLPELIREQREFDALPVSLERLKRLKRDRIIMLVLAAIFLFLGLVGLLPV